MLRIIVLILALLSVGCAPLGYPVASWQYVQQQRVAAGVPALEWDGALAVSAQARAQGVAALGVLDHGGAQAASDVFYGDRPSICELLGNQPTWTGYHAIGYGWIRSPAHRGCALGANYRRAGMGAAVGADGWIYEVLWLTE